MPSRKWRKVNFFFEVDFFLRKDHHEGHEDLKKFLKKFELMKILKGVKVEITKWARYPPTAKHIDSSRTRWGTYYEGLSRESV